jgi:tRNA (cmo5U34)-methyltransferase
LERDEVFAGSQARGTDFVFDAGVAAVFEDMLRRSVPFYDEQQRMLAEIARRFYIPGTVVYDLGCSTGTTLLALERVLDPGARLVGYDNSLPMLDRARRQIEEVGAQSHVEVTPADFNGDLESLRLDGASVVVMAWTLQFVRPLRRDTLIRWIYQALAENGALVVTDKVLTASSHMNRFFIDWYYEFKRRNGYSEDEILRKREALENVLIPYRIDENLEMFRRNGFEIVETFFQWYNFAGFLCVKKPV